MNYNAIIEIPKNGDRRIHFAYNRKDFIDLGKLGDVIPVNDGLMPLHYGFITTAFNNDEGDEIDVLIFSKRDYKTQDKVAIRPIGMMIRADGDHKVIATDDTVDYQSFADAPADEQKKVLDFNGFKHPITSMIDAEETTKFLESCVFNPDNQISALQIRINKPVEETFEFVTNPKNTPAWIDAIEQEETSEWPIKVGTVYRNANKEGVWSEYVVSMLDDRKDKMFCLKQKDGGYSVKYNFEPTSEGGTKLTYTEWMKSGPLENPLKYEALEKLKEILEK